MMMSNRKKAGNIATVKNYSTNFTITVERALAGYDFTSADFRLHRYGILLSE